MERRRLVRNQIRQIEEARQERLDHVSGDGPHAMVRLLARVIGVGIETADMLVHEVLSRNMRDRRAVARYAGLIGLARRERQKTPGERVGPFRQWSSSARHDPIGVALPYAPEGQRLGAVVSSPHRQRPRHS